MSIRFEKPWQPREDAQALGGHLGVFELGSEDGEILYIGYAGGRSRYGLREVVATALATFADACSFRVEINTAYLTRYQELLMVHCADHDGELPLHNRANIDVVTLGKLSPLGHS